jgi:aspartyl-tRNA(Asn)/glutamyl-tRNA(Gln) amidotransferase subunit C
MSEPSSGTARDDEGDEAAVDADTVRHVAELARLDLDEDEVERFAEQFAGVLAHFETLDDVPSVETEPRLTNVLRPDEERAGLSREAALRNAPETEDGYVKGPHV